MEMAVVTVGALRHEGCSQITTTRVPTLGYFTDWMSFLRLVSVKHIVVASTHFNDTCNKYFIASCMKELFKTVDVRR